MLEFDSSIVAMKIEDIDEVLVIEALSFATPWSREAFTMEICDNRCARYLVAKGTKVLGYVGMWIIMDEGHITNIAVHPDYRGNKIGEALLKAIIKLASSIGITQMTLEVRKSNKIAQNLYLKLGFEVCGIRKKYYSNNKEDALIMWNHNINAKSDTLELFS
jgi:[ribosomal protein S18]-alanine N-acetyltransferase